MTATEISPEDRIASLEKMGADHYDPVRFCYIASLARRAEGKGASVHRIIEKKLSDAIDTYKERFEKARGEAKVIVDRLSSEDSRSAEELQACYEKCDFEGIRRQWERHNRDKGSRPLEALTNQLRRNEHLYKNDETLLTLHERLLQQEEDVLRSVSDSQSATGAMNSDSTMEPGSFRLFKEILAKRYAERLVNDAITKRPENPGHLNGQMLATRCLFTMRRLSPSYLNRFVAYLNALFLLEQFK